MKKSTKIKEIQSILNKAYWLRPTIKNMIFEALISAKNIHKTNLIKLCKILAVIPYAETVIRKKGKKLTFFLKIIGLYFPFFQILCNTLSPWNLSVIHAKKFNLSKKKFRKILNSDKSIYYVIKYLENFISIKKDPKRIFAEYQIGEDATIIAAIQRALNILFKDKNIELFEDGIFGQKTSEACKLLPIKYHNSKDYKKILKYLEKKLDTKMEYIIPKVVSKRGFKYLFKGVIKKDYKCFFNFFRNCVNLPLYISSAMEGYKIF